MLGVRFEAVPELCVSDLPNVSSTHSGLHCAPPNLRIVLESCGMGAKKLPLAVRLTTHVLT